MSRFIKRALIAILFTVFFMLVIFPIGLAQVSVYTLRHQACKETESLQNYISSAESLQITPQNTAYRLDGWFVAGEHPATVIILAGAWGSRDNMYAEAQFLSEFGYNILTLDTRSCAQPPQATSLGYTEKADLTAALDYLSNQPDLASYPIGVLGHSMGGATAIMTAAEDERIQATAVTGNYIALKNSMGRGLEFNESPKRGLWEHWFRFWLEQAYRLQVGVSIEQVSPLDAIPQISPRPVFLIYGSDEVQSNGQRLYDAAGNPKTLWIVEGAQHGTYVQVAEEAYKNRLISFFDQYLLNDHD